MERHYQIIKSKPQREGTHITVFNFILNRSYKGVCYLLQSDIKELSIICSCGMGNIRVCLNNLEEDGTIKNVSEHQERLIESKIKKKKDRPKYHHAVNISKNYGITEEDYQRMYDEQCGFCAICGQISSTKHGRLSIDHCHTTGKVRGLLCTACNMGLGSFKDNIDLLIGAINYLAKY